jgi:predicted MPP superfamily phosphohydrolase
MGWMLRTILIIAAIALPLYLYVGLKVASSIALVRPAAKRRARRSAMVAIVWCFILPVTALLLYLTKTQTTLFLPSRPVGLLDYLFYYPSWLSVIIVAELFPLFAVIDLLSLGSRLFPSYREAVRKFLAWGRIALISFALLYVPLRSLVDTTHVRDTVAQVHLPHLPPEFDQLRITLVGDIQVDRYTGESKVSQVRDIIARQAPDLLLFPGDLVTSGTDFLNEAKVAICGLKGTLGSVGVMGDHDFWSAPERVREIELSCGWEFLDNQHRVFTYHGKTICISGLTNIYADRLTAAQIDSFLSSAPAADLHILLTHQPANRIIQQVVAHRYDLLLAGHTHGGQIEFHPLGIPVTASLLETRYYTGVHREDAATIVVTNGVGISIAPLRYHAPAEVTTMILGR